MTPQGSPHKLGEIVPNSSYGSSIMATNALQAFGLIATAEPYSAVHHPGDVVVLENEIRPDTVGRIQPITAKYELMPRGQYTSHVHPPPHPTPPKLSTLPYTPTPHTHHPQNAT